MSVFQVSILFLNWQELAALDSVFTAKKEELEQIVSAKVHIVIRKFCNLSFTGALREMPDEAGRR